MKQISGVTHILGRKAVWAGLGMALALLLAWAWIDGGREVVRPLAVAVPVPGATR